MRGRNIILDSLLQKTLSKGQVRLRTLDLCTDIQLYLYDPDVLQGPISHEEAQAVVAEPAYWSFCWASGQVLAASILQHPEWIQNKVVVDFGTGSGVVAIAAAMAGAKKVIACDLDSDALTAADENARANRCEIECVSSLEGLADDVDVITAADVLYDRDNFPLLQSMLDMAQQVILADSRIKQLPHEGYIKMFTRECCTCPDLGEFEEFNQVRVYRATAG